MTGCALALLLVILSMSSASAAVSIALSSPPLDDLKVMPGQEFSIHIRVYNNSADDSFTAHLEALEDLPVSFASNDFELLPGTNRQVEVSFEIPSGWELGSVREGEISVTAVTPSEPGEGAASAQVLGSLSKDVVLKIGEETNIPEEEPEEGEETPLELSVSLGVGSEPRPDHIFRQDETLIITAHTNGEADISCILKDPLGDRPVGMEGGSECYVGSLELNDVIRRDYPFGGYLLIVTASRGDYEAEVPVIFQVLEAAPSGFPWGLAVAVAIAVVSVGFFALFATRRRWLQWLKQRLKAPEAKKVEVGAIFFFLILSVALAPSVTAQEEASGEAGVNNVSPTVESISVDATLADRDVDYEGSGATESVEISVRVRDNNGNADIAPLRLSIRDGNDSVVVDNIEVTENSVVDGLTLEFSYIFNPPDSLSDGAMGKFDVRAEGWDESEAGVSDYTELGFELFTVDDLITTIGVDDPTPYRHQRITVLGSVSRVYGTASLDNAWVLDQIEGTLVAEVVGNMYGATYEVTSNLGATVSVHARAFDESSGLDGISPSVSYTVVSSPALWVLLSLGAYEEEEAPADVDPDLQPGTYVSEEWVPRDWFYPGETCFLRAYVRDANTDNPVTHARVEMTLVYGNLEFEVRNPESGLWEGALLLMDIPTDGHTIEVDVFAEGYTNWHGSCDFELVEAPVPPPPVVVPWWQQWWAWLGIGAVVAVAVVLLWRFR